MPPQLGQPTQSQDTADVSQFRVKGNNLRRVTAGGSMDPHSKHTYGTVIINMRMRAHKYACGRWLAFGMCRKPNCAKLHGDWLVYANGEIINSTYRDLARIAGVPQDWQPTGRGRP